jgi:uncharacterized protein (DUF2062 family)
MGAALGAAISFTPFIGLHPVLTFAAAWLLGANMIAGALGAAIGNPLTFPMMWASTYELGHSLMNRVTPDSPQRLYQLLKEPLRQIPSLIEPMLVGSIALGLGVGALVYVIVYRAVGEGEARRPRAARVETGRDS